MSDKKGIQFFKSFAGGGKPSILAGMRIKSNKQTKPASQTETHLSFTEKKQQIPSSSKDDFTLTKKTSQQYVPPTELKEQEPSFKKSKPADSSSAVIQKKKQSLRSKIETKIYEEPIKPLVIESYVSQKKEKDHDLQSNKSSVFSSEEGTLTSETPTSIKPVKHKEEKQAQKKKVKPEKVETKKSDEPFSAATRKGSTSIQPKKPKKSDREQILDELNESTLSLVNIILKQKQIKEHISQSKQTITELRNNMSIWASKQALCAQREQYEQADRLQTEIEESQKKVEEHEIELTYMEQQISNKEQEQLALLKTQNSNIKRLSRRLKLIELQLQDDAANLKRQQMERIQQLRTKQESEKKKMQRLEKDINYQSEQLGEFQRQFKQQVNSKMSPLIESKNTLESQKIDLEAQIKELQRKLKQKKNSLVELSKELKGVVDQITETEAQFKEESQKLQEQKNKLEVIENERDEMQLGINEIESTIQGQVRQMDQRIQQKLKEANQLSQLAKNMEQKQLSFEDDMQSRRVLLDSYLINARCMKQFEQKHRQEKDKIKDLEYRKSTVSAEITKLQERKDELKKKIPGLESQQKKYADQKNFKAAGIKKGQIKQINQELAHLKERLDDCLGEEHALQVELEELVSGQKQTIEEENQLQKNLASSQVKLNVEKVEKLREYKGEVERSSRMGVKEKQRIVRELNELIFRMQTEIKQLSSRFDLLSPSKPKEQQAQEEQNQEELEQDNQQEQEEVDKQEEQQENDNEDRPENKEEQDNDEQEGKGYTPLVIESEHQQQPEDNNQESGYVPLQLD